MSIKDCIFLLPYGLYPGLSVLLHKNWHCQIVSFWTIEMIIWIIFFCVTAFREGDEEEIPFCAFGIWTCSRSSWQEAWYHHRPLFSRIGNCFVSDFFVIPPMDIGYVLSEHCDFFCNTFFWVMTSCTAFFFLIYKIAAEILIRSSSICFFCHGYCYKLLFSSLQKRLDKVVK